MTINRTTLLDLPLPVTGTESGTWGDIVNNGLSEYIDISVAGSLSLSADSDTNLSSTEGNAAGTNIGSTTAQYAILRCTGARTATRNINAPAWAISGGTLTNYSKIYIVVNETTGGQNIVLRATNSATPTYTTGVTIVPGERAVCAWNGSDFVKVGGAAGGSTTQIQFNNAGVFGGSANLTWDGTNVQIGATGALRLADTDSSNYVAFKSPASVASNVTWTLPSADGTNGQALTTNGSGTLAFSSVTTSPGGSTTQVQYNNAGAFAGSSNLTFDGTNLTVGGTATATKLIPTGNVTAGNGMYLPTTNTLAFSTDGTERMRITSAGNVGIGDSSPGYKLTVATTTLIYTDSVNSNNYSLSNGGTNYGGGVAPYLTVAGAGGSYGYLLIKGGDGGTSNTANMAFANKNSAGNYILGALIACNVTTATAGSEVQVFRIAVNSGGTVTDRMRINADGTIKTSATISVGDATPSTSGAGITFPATQSASTDANTLDDYEEGTFTPTLSASATAPTVSTYTTRTGRYIKIGSLVTCFIHIYCNISNAGSGYPIITGLPFTIATNADSGVSLGRWSAINSVVPVQAIVLTDGIYFESSSYVTGNNLYFNFSATYRV